MLFGFLKIYKSPSNAIAILNTYALYLAFPALIFAGVADSGLGLSPVIGFVTLVPFAFLIVFIMLLKSFQILSDIEAGVAGLGSTFGNIAYLGIPICASIIGSDVVGLASYVAALHLIVGLSVGPGLLLWGSNSSNNRLDIILKKLMRQPLLWASIMGFCAQIFPRIWIKQIIPPVAWIGQSAGPVAVFIIGLYLWTKWRSILHFDRADWILLALKLFVLPAFTWVGLAWASGMGWLDSRSANVVLLQSSMPIAITTFAITEAYGVGQEKITRGIVATTGLFLLLLPLIATIVIA